MTFNKKIIIVAGGKGERMRSDLPKQFIKLLGRPILMHTIEQFAHCMPQAEVVVVLPQDQISLWKTLCEEHSFVSVHRVVAGGRTRFHSVKNGLQALNSNETTLIAIHDGVRPLVSRETIERCFATAQSIGSAIPCVDMVDSLRYLQDDKSQAVDRNRYKAVQTPQVFRASWLQDGYEQPFDPTFTDDASVVERAGYAISLTDGNRENIKITTSEDLLIATVLMEQQDA